MFISSVYPDFSPSDSISLVGREFKCGKRKRHVFLILDNCAIKIIKILRKILQPKILLKDSCMTVSSEPSY